MKQLGREAFERARHFLKTQARPLERATFEHRFEGGTPERVVAELARFQNDDGGFGRALEPDVRTPSSSALATGIGLRTLKELGRSADDPLVQRAVKFLLDTFDDGTKVWRVTAHDTNAHPHAPWWHDEEGSLARTFDGFQIIPRAEIVGLLHYFVRDRDALVPADWLEEVTEDTVAAIEMMEESAFGGGGDGLCYALSLAEMEGVPERFKERLVLRLRGVTSVVVSRDPEEWGSYCAPPLKVAPSPRSIVADLLRDDLQAHLDYQIDHQTLAGTWDPVWSWSGLYPDVWEKAKREWRGHLTLEALRTLRAYGRIEE